MLTQFVIARRGDIHPISTTVSTTLTTVITTTVSTALTTVITTGEWSA